MMLEVCIINKNLVCSNRSDGTRMQQLYLFCNYHMSQLLLLDMDFYLTISMDVHYCINLLMVLPKVSIIKLEMLVLVLIKAIMDILEAMVE